MSLRTPGVGHREDRDEDILAHHDVIVQLPSRTARGCVGTDLGHQVQRVRGLVLLLSSAFSRAVLLLDRLSREGAT